MYNYNLNFMKFMKKIGVFLVFSLAFLFSISAQDNTAPKNWFLGIGVNGNVYLNNVWKKSDVWTKPSIGGELFVGKWFSSKVGARLALQGGAATPWFEKTDGSLYKENEVYALGRLELMVNLTNLFKPYSQDRFFNLIPHIGVGGFYVNAQNNLFKDYTKDTYMSYAITGGLMGTFRLSCATALYIDLKGDIVDTKFDGDRNASKLLNGLFSPSVGLMVNLGTCKAAPVAPVATEVVNNFANQQREETPPPPPPPAPTPAPAPAPAPAPVVAPAPYPLNVFFRIGGTTIAADQQPNVATAAKYMNDNPTTKIKVVGYADKGTGSRALNLRLSEQRAKAVAKMLVDKYKVSSDRIAVDWKGDTEQPFKVAKQNRVAIIMGN